MNMKLRRTIIGLLFIVVGLWWIWSSRSLSVVVERREIQVGEESRQYRVVKPGAAAVKKNLPLVIALPGALDTAEQMAEYTQLDKLCAQKQFVLAYLEGRHLNWPPAIPEEFPDVFEPDLTFFDAVCDQLEKEGIDGGRIYVVGVSQGGCMANMLVMKRNRRIAAAVINCGWMPKPLDISPPVTEHKCPLLFIVGSHDKQVEPETVRLGSELFKMASHPIRYEVLDGAGHGWNAAYGVNEMVWQFLSNKENRN